VHAEALRSRIWLSTTEVREEVSSARVRISSGGTLDSTTTERTRLGEAMHSPGTMRRLGILRYSMELISPASTRPSRNRSAHREGTWNFRWKCSNPRPCLNP